MKWLYLLLNLGSFSIPLIYSFNRKMRFIRFWKPLFLSTILVASPFLIWDALFTKYAIWGFNESYHLGISILGMPLEEWLFFFCIPYASIFIHYSLEHFKPNLLLSNKAVKGITIFLLALSTLLILLYSDRWYTLIDFSFLIISLFLGLIWGQKILQRFYVSFFLVLIPFFLVNGILTGSFIPDEVVWYNDAENMGFRLFTIPVEDIAYAFSLLFLNVLLFEYLKLKFKGLID